VVGRKVGWPGGKRKDKQQKTRLLKWTRRVLVKGTKAEYPQGTPSRRRKEAGKKPAYVLAELAGRGDTPPAGSLRGPKGCRKCKEK